MIHIWKSAKPKVSVNNYAFAMTFWSFGHIGMIKNLEATEKMLNLPRLNEMEISSIVDLL